MKYFTKFFYIILLIAGITGCFNDSKDKPAATDTVIGSDKISMKVTGGQPNGYIDLKVVDETTKIVVTALSIDISPTTDKTDGSGNYTKVLTGLVPGHTYSILIMVDVDDDVIVDGVDKGQMKTGLSTGTEVLFDNLQVLKRIDVTGSTDAALANKIASCGIGRFDYTTQYFPDIVTPGYLTFAGVQYSASGLTSSYFPGYLPSGTYGNIFCMVDIDNNDVMNTNDKYQFISGPVVINSGDTVKSYSLGSWTTY